MKGCHCTLIAKVMITTSTIQCLDRFIDEAELDDRSGHFRLSRDRVLAQLLFAWRSAFGPRRAAIPRFLVLHQRSVRPRSGTIRAQPQQRAVTPTVVHRASTIRQNGLLRILAIFNLTAA
jgi:hypothetical protein